MPLEPVKKREPMTIEDKAFNVRNDPVVQDMWINAIRNSKSKKLNLYQKLSLMACKDTREQGRFLSEKQAEILEEIYSEI